MWSDFFTCLCEFDDVNWQSEIKNADIASPKTSNMHASVTKYTFDT